MGLGRPGLTTDREGPSTEGLCRGDGLGTETKEVPNVRTKMVMMLATSGVGSAWVGPSVVDITEIVSRTVLLLAVLLFLAWLCVLWTGRDVSVLTEVLRVVLGRGRDPDPDHPPDKQPDP